MLGIIMTLPDGVLQPLRVDQDDLVIGRGPGSDLEVDDTNVSRRHLRLFNDHGLVLLEDLGSLNGTYVNGRRVRRRVPLTTSDTVTFGDCKLVLEPPPVESPLGSALRRAVTLQPPALRPSQRPSDFPSPGELELDLAPLRIPWTAPPSALEWSPDGEKADRRTIPAPRMTQDSLPPVSGEADARLRGLLLFQARNGLFQRSVGTTLAAVAAFVLHGNTSTEGPFSLDMRRALHGLRAALPALKGAERDWAALAVAILLMSDAEPPPDELRPDLAGLLSGLAVAGRAGARLRILEALHAVPAGWAEAPWADEIRRDHLDVG